MGSGGRKPLDTVVRETKLYIKVSIEEMERIEEITKYLEIPRTTVARNFLLYGLEDAELFRKIGLLAIAKKIKKTSIGLNILKDIRINNKPAHHFL